MVLFYIHMISRAQWPDFYFYSWALISERCIMCSFWYILLLFLAVCCFSYMKFYSMLIDWSLFMWFVSIMLLPPSQNFESCKSVIEHHFFTPLSKERKEGRKGKRRKKEVQQWTIYLKWHIRGIRIVFLNGVRNFSLNAR